MNHASILSELRPTTVIESDLLNKRFQARIILISETFQRTGSFKFRAGLNVAASVPHPKIIAASSGNFGQGLAYACQLKGKECVIVMPENSSPIKVEAIRNYGAQIDFIDTRQISRHARVAQLAETEPDAYIASAYDDPLVIAGNATLGVEIAGLDYPFDEIIAPIGGGGLTSGLVEGMRQANRAIPLIAAEPALGNDAAQSLRAGKLVKLDHEPATIADGARTLSLGKANWRILQNALQEVIEVPEADIATAIQVLFREANLKVEPTGALALAAILATADQRNGKTIGCVISGGNVDPGPYKEWIG